MSNTVGDVMRHRLMRMRQEQKKIILTLWNTNICFKCIQIFYFILFFF